MIATTCTFAAMPPKEKPAPEKKAATVSTRISAAEVEALEQLATSDDRTISYLVAKAIREFLERHGRKRK